MLDHNKANNISVKTTTIEHNPILNFYSADGKLADLTDKNVQLQEQVFVDNTSFLKRSYEKFIPSYVTIGRWHLACTSPSRN
ncbi:hypothetical protein Q2T40_01510 [Winogradskyella maritima]|nr:hypothetical protein [Winogradskyella maritima]